MWDAYDISSYACGPIYAYGAEHSYFRTVNKAKILCELKSRKFYHWNFRLYITFVYCTHCNPETKGRWNAAIKLIATDRNNSVIQYQYTRMYKDCATGTLRTFFFPSPSLVFHQHWASQEFLPDWSPPDCPSQHSLQAALDSDQLHHLLNASTTWDYAHLSSTYMGQFTSFWLLAISSPNFGLDIAGCEFTHALRYSFFDLWLCGFALDPDGDYLLGYVQGLLRIHYHDVLHIFCSKLSIKIIIKLKESSAFWLFCYLPRRHFPPWFDDYKPTYFDISVRNSLLPQFLNRASFSASIISSVSEMDKNIKYNHSGSSAGFVFFPLVVKTLDLWTDSSISLLHHITACTTLRSGASQAQAFHNLPKQLSIKLWSYNVKILLCRISLFPVSEPDPLDQSLFSLEEISNFPGLTINSIPYCAVNIESLVDAQDST